MKNRIFFLILLLSVITAPSFARHLKGGFFSYQYLGVGSQPNTALYKITLTEYMDCDATGMQIDPQVNFSFFNATSNSFVQNISVQQKQLYLLSKPRTNPVLPAIKPVVIIKLLCTNYHQLNYRLQLMVLL